jgi:hypothetical protein
MQRTRINLLVAAGALVVLTSTAACNGSVSGAPASGQSNLPTFGSTEPTQPTQPTEPTAPVPPSATAPSAPPNTQPEPADPVQSGDCKAAELKLSIGRGEGTAGTTFRPVRFTNSGTRSCTIQGFPGVSYVAGDDGHQVGPAAFREGTKGAAITLAPGQTAFATVGFVQVHNFDPNVCRPTPTRGLRIYPPHDTASMFLPVDGTGCAGTPPGNQLTVRTVQKGSGGD